MKILIIGREPSDFFNPICKYLSSSGYKVDLLEYRPLSETIDCYNIVHEEYYKLFNLNSYKWVDILLGFFTIQFLKGLFDSFSIKSALRKVLLQKNFQPLFCQYDIINFHAIEEKSILLSSFVPEGIKIIFSFWGSDLFVEKQGRLEKQKYALQRADRVTLHSPEMKEIYKKKFNLDGLLNVKFQLFGIVNSFFECCEKLNKNQFFKEEFINYLNIPQNRTVVTVSYCGKPISNQCSIITTINKLNQIEKSNLHLIIPLSYGSTDDYKKEVKGLTKYQNYSCTFIESFLEYEELIKYKVVSDVYIHANVSDAFSRSMLENIYCENICLIAKWLPYSLLKDVEVSVIWFDSFNDLKKKIEETLFNINELKIRVKSNPQIIKKSFSEEATVEKWVKMFKELS